MKRIVGILLFLLGVGLLISIVYLNSSSSRERRTFSSYTLLSSSWEKYKQRFIHPDGRVIDYSQNSITTSEGQSYAMLQAVWMDDKETFDQVYKWTKDNLHRTEDRLFSWRWGLHNDGSYGPLPDGGENSASDADTDIALALLMAAQRWQKSDYINEAKPLISDIWNVETEVAQDKRYLIAGNWARSATEIVINPSYFAPYAWRLFAKIDTDHDWLSLIDPAYDFLHQVSTNPLDKSKSVGLPPDWVAMPIMPGEATSTKLPLLTTDYGFDAMRIPWRIAMDYRWNNEVKAKTYLESLYFLGIEYERQGKLPSGFSHDGIPLNEVENPTMYAAALGYFQVVRPDLADVIYKQKIIQLYSNDTNSFREDLPYYEENWLWFGSAFYLNQLTPLNTPPL